MNAVDGFEGLAVSDKRPNVLLEKTMQFSLEVISLQADLSAGNASQVISRQLLRSATSIGAQYREGCRARSKAEFYQQAGERIAGGRRKRLLARIDRTLQAGV
jgi:hypothetical protein